MLVVLHGLFEVADLLEDLFKATEAVRQVPILDEFQDPVGCLI